jgi:hypothetical protein
MKIPKKFKSQGIWWKVRFVENVGDNDLGEADYEKQEIRIKKDISQELKEQTFLHEVGHTLNTTIDHALMDSLIMQYFQVLKDAKII